MAAVTDTRKRTRPPTAGSTYQVRAISTMLQTHPLQIGVRSQLADLQEFAEDVFRTARGISQRKFDLLPSGLRRERRDDTEIDIPDHVVGQNEQIRRMQIGMEDAEPESVAQKICNDVVAED